MRPVQRRFDCPSVCLSVFLSVCLPFVCVSLSVIVIVVDVLCVCLCVCVNLMGIPQRKCSAQAQKDRKGQRQQECQGRRQERGAIGKGGEEGTQLARAQVKTCSLFVLTEALKHILIVLTLRQRKCCILQGQRIVCITVSASQ